MQKLVYLQLLFRLSNLPVLLLAAVVSYQVPVPGTVPCTTMHDILYRYQYVPQRHTFSGSPSALLFIVCTIVILSLIVYASTWYSITVELIVCGYRRTACLAKTVPVEQMGCSHYVILNSRHMLRKAGRICDQFCMHRKHTYWCMYLVYRVTER